MGNQAVSTLIAAKPIVVLFVLLAGLRVAAQWASLITLAVAPVIAVLVYGMPLFPMVQIPPIKAAVGATQMAINFPTAEVSEKVEQRPLVVPGAAPYAATYPTNWPSAAGTIILIADIIALVVLRVGPGRALRIYGENLNQLKWAILTIASIPGLAYLLNYSGITFTPGPAFASTGFLSVFFAPFIGWLGVALTGSDTSSNALFANLQKVTAQQIGVSPNLTVGANSSGGVLGKMIPPQNLAVGTSATGLQGRQGDPRACS